MGWRDFQNPSLVEKMEKMEKIPSNLEQIPLIPFIPPNVDSKNPDSTFLDHLTEVEREYYRDLVEIMQSEKFGMDRSQAQREAGRIIARNRQPLQVKQAAQDYRRHGYCRIFSTVLDGVVYLARDREAAKRVPDLNTPVYLESDVESVKGLDLEVAKVLLEARMLFGGPIKVEEYTEPPSNKKMDGKQIARNFYGEKQ